VWAVGRELDGLVWFIIIIIITIIIIFVARDSIVAKALSYKLECRGFETR
jgi:hypothetical protein